MPANSSGTIFDQSSDDDTLGSRILKARKLSAMTRDDVAQNIGVKQTTVDSWEKGKSEPRAHHIVRLSGMLGVSPTWMLGGLGPAPTSESIGDEVCLIRRQLDQLKETRDQTTLVIESIEKTLDRLLKQEI